MIKLICSSFAIAWLSTVASASQSCNAANFSRLDIPGAEILNITTSIQTNVSGAAYAQFPAYSGISFCEVNVVFTHPGGNDTVTTGIWLPLSGWNGRFQATGGGGWSSGFPGLETGPAAEKGYSAAWTDGGNLGFAFDINPAAFTGDYEVIPAIWADYIDRSIHDMAVIGKAVTGIYYGRDADFSYWNGCSTGGRQGVQAAQTWPEDFDGIVAGAPVVNLAQVVVGIEWPYIVMNKEKTFPSQCIYDTFMNASISQCDNLDGVEDGVISNVRECDFDPFSLIGEPVHCDGKTTTISESIATVYRKILEGPRTPSGEFLWYGYEIGVHTDDIYNGSAHTVTTNGTTIAVPFGVSDSFIQYFMERNATFDTSTLTYAQFVHIAEETDRRYGYNSSNNPNLTDFRNAGGKMIVWHGLADNLAMPMGTVNYRERVNALMGGNHAVDDFWRLFFAPGVSHCGGGYGPIPTDPLTAVVAWVENGTIPDTLAAQYTDPVGDIVDHDICRYPLVSRYDGTGDPKVASSYTCASSFA